MRRHRHRPPWARHHDHHHGRRQRTLRGTLMAGAIASVVVTGAIVGTVAFSGPGSGRGGVEDIVRFATFVAHDEALRDPQRRSAFLRDAAAALDGRLVLHAENGTVLLAAGDGECRHPVAVDVAASDRFDGPPLWLEACRPHGGGPPLRGLMAVGLVLAALSTVSSVLARRLGRPLQNLADTAWRIGQGDLRARPDLGRRPPLEVAVVGDALTDMASRIERELEGQRALLAGASHELRTPLGHVRLQVELARTRLTGDQQILDDIDAEITDIDTLLEKLLASARLDFRTLDKRPVVLTDLVARALERAGLPSSLLFADADGAAATIDGDVTLLGRAIGNLLENGASHGGGVTAVRVGVDGSRVRVTVDDDGPGVADDDRDRIFEPFVHRADRAQTEAAGSLGLGLHLVRRIAEAHGGRVSVVAGPDGPDGGGGHFQLELPTTTTQA